MSTWTFLRSGMRGAATSTSPTSCWAAGRPRVGEVPESLVFVRENDLELFDKRQRGDRNLEKAISRLSGDPDQTRRRQAAPHLFISRGAARALAPPAGDDRTREALGRTADDDETVFDGKKPGAEKRSSEPLILTASPRLGRAR